MKNLAPIVAFFAATALLAASASAAPRNHRYHHHSRTAADAYTAPRQIACTVVGCHPIPRGCHPEMGYTPDGIPTGFDVAVCGNYTLYGNRR
jgi:hypothetical protein